MIGVLLLGSFLSVGPTVRIASVHRFAIFLLPAGPPTPQWANLPLANTPRSADGKPNLTAPASRTADGKPDLSGVWIAEDQKYFMDLATGLKPEDVRLLPWAALLQKQRVDDAHADDPLAKCLPHGVPRVN